MTDDAINKKLAKLCGLWLSQDETLYYVENYTYIPIPRYTEDLNAIHEARELLLKKESLWNDYIVRLAKVIAGVKRGKVQVPTNVLFQSSARQQAEALLRTLKEWQR